MKRKYSGKMRDFETNLDDFGARYNSSSLGRFMSPDWAAKPVSVPYANLTNPRTLNLYVTVAEKLRCLPTAREMLYCDGGSSAGSLPADSTTS